MKINITQMRDYLKCPQMAYNLHELPRVPRNKSVALDIGSMFHKLMELRLKADSSDNTLLDILQTEAWLNGSQKAKDAWLKHRLWSPIKNFELPNGWEIIAVEEALEREISDDIILQGRLDVIIKYNGKYWDINWKTYTEDLNTLIDRVRLGWHSVGYQWLGEDKYYPWGGSILGACQKLPSYRMITGGDGKKHKYVITDEDRCNVFTLHYLSRSSQMQSRMFADLKSNIIDMAMLWGNNQRNYDSCFRPHGRGRCPYFDVCHNGGDLGGPEFETAAPRYEV